MNKFLLVRCFCVCISVLISPPTCNTHLLSQQNILLSSPNTTTQVVEHIVLFDVKQSLYPEKYVKLRKGLKDLATIHEVLMLSAGDVYRSSSNFNLLLHARFRNKQDLKNYLNNPKHLGLLSELVNPIADVVFVFDWFAHLDGPLVPPSGSAMRLNLFKLKESFVDSEREQVLEGIGALKDVLGVETLGYSYGENFNPKDAYGFTVGCMVTFPGLKELDEMDASEAMGTIQGLIETTIEVDYIY